MRDDLVKILLFFWRVKNKTAELQGSDYNEAQFTLQRIKLSLHPTEQFEVDLKSILQRAANALASEDKGKVSEVYLDMEIVFQRFIKERWDELKLELEAGEILLSNTSESKT